VKAVESRTYDDFRQEIFGRQKVEATRLQRVGTWCDAYAGRMRTAKGERAGRH
jgi:hypothetical protein